jgi:beta-glucanase (GH16 family)
MRCSVRSRLLLSGLATVIVAGLIAWGLAPRAAGSGGHALAAPKKSQYDIAESVPAYVQKMRLVFAATFKGTRLNTSVWSTCYLGTADPAAGCTNFNNPEKEWYLPSQDQVYGGALHLVSQKTRTMGTDSSGNSVRYACRSGIVTTHPGLNFEYGYIQVVAHVPDDPGLWPALWLAASNGHWPPEIDLLEHWGPPKNTTGVYFHPLGGTQTVVRFDPGDLFRGWHTFAVNWTKSQVTWYIDGRLVVTVRRHVPHQRMYLIANLAHYLDSRDPSAACTGTMLIRSVKVWQ